MFRWQYLPQFQYVLNHNDGIKQPSFSHIPVGINAVKVRYVILYRSISITFYNFTDLDDSSYLVRNRIRFTDFYRFVNVFGTNNDISTYKFFDFGVRSIRYQVVRFYGLCTSLNWQKRVSYVHQF